ncbi:hypothetical protein [Rhodoferax sp.]|uniref:hypothetical protein n=1 Tax=Rhodoferax sp. TaxID=50421 RepID=UPI00275504B7|nr:hypothetical protein [Rhodoferax sp.]
MSNESVNTSGDLIRWLKMLALPIWAKLGLALIMLLVLFSALGLLVWGLIQQDRESISSAVAMLTVGLPIGLIVVALVFGDGGARKLKSLTQLVLSQEVPEAIRKNLSACPDGSHLSHAEVHHSVQGCIADYRVLTRLGDTRRTALEFKLELNVKKVNFVVWIAVAQTEPASDLSAQLEAYQSCLFGAANEGYVYNKLPIRGERDGLLGLVFIKNLNDDFLINPAERLYFAQDLAFFVRGLLNVEITHA